MYTIWKHNKQTCVFTKANGSICSFKHYICWLPSMRRGEKHKQAQREKGGEEGWKGRMKMSKGDATALCSLSDRPILPADCPI